LADVFALQWSRRLSTAETYPGRTWARVGSAASMEPPSLDGGDLDGGVDAIEDGRHASMEPPSLDGGDGNPDEGDPQMTDVLQWSRRLSPAETSPLGAVVLFFQPASMEPPSLDGGDSIRNVLLPRRTRRFNGAAVSRRRRLFVVGEVIAVGLFASMEPPSLD